MQNLVFLRSANGELKIRLHCSENQYNEKDDHLILIYWTNILHSALVVFSEGFNFLKGLAVNEN